MCGYIDDAIMNSLFSLLLCLSNASFFVSHVDSLSTSTNDRPIIDEYNIMREKKKIIKYKNKLIKKTKLSHSSFKLKIKSNITIINPNIYCLLIFQGILTHEFHSSLLNDEYPNQYDSYIAASYVKFVEGAGALVVPIWIGKDESYYEDVISKVNGILLPGGSARLFHKNGFADAGTFIYKIASRLNSEGDYFPIWGTCLGFQLLTYVASGGIEHRTDCASRLQSLPLEFVSGYESSTMFRNATSLIVDILSNHNVTTNYHRRCVTREILKNLNLTSKFRVMSINHNWNGLEFISTIEQVDFPFYGTQFHPETNLYEWMESKKYITHTAEATLASQYFANFFVNEARKNSHYYLEGTEIDELIYNYAITFTARKNLRFTQCYMFANETKND